MPVKSSSLKWILNKEEHQTVVKPIYETQGHYPNYVLSQTDNESNKGGRAKSWTKRVIHHLKSLKSGNK